MVLSLRCQYAHPSPIAHRPRSPCDGEVVGFGSPACEDQLCRFGPDGVRYRLAGTLERGMRLAAEPVHRRGVPKRLPEIRTHDIENLWVERRRCGMIKIHAMHLFNIRASG